MFYALACVPQGNVVTNKSYTNDCLWDTSRGKSVVQIHIFFKNFKYIQNFYSKKNLEIYLEIKKKDFNFMLST
ncbi:MAG: hypothetical protein EAZ85_00320 [Bacteroidetes bacterium]|nr:MAG: hypothetical protein EAZ85_00320 [Bacteroidota bacterium]TAG90337.1 MAG: hypothetical protein EAZ20_04645 [Bacteroidota bacterium]